MGPAVRIPSAPATRHCELSDHFYLRLQVNAAFAAGAFWSAQLAIQFDDRFVLGMNNECWFTTAHSLRAGTASGSLFFSEPGQDRVSLLGVRSEGLSKDVIGRFVHGGWNLNFVLFRSIGNRKVRSTHPRASDIFFMRLSWVRWFSLVAAVTSSSLDT